MVALKTSSTILSTRVPAMDNIGVASERKLRAIDFALPEGTILVSSDSHFTLWDDFWVRRAPPLLADRVPRVWRDEKRPFWHLGIGGHSIFPPALYDWVESMDGREGFGRLPERLLELDIEGVAKEIVFPQAIPRFFTHSDIEAREWIYRAYNEHIAEVAESAPDRFYPVAIPNYWDPEKAPESIQRIKALGLKTFMLPINPGKDGEGRSVIYADDRWRPMWEAAEEAGLPVCFHIGETMSIEGPGAIGISVLVAFTPFRKSFGELVFGGIFDRHPRLKIVFAEANINWVPAVLQDAEITLDTFNRLLSPKIQKRPTDYWREHCYSTFMHDKVGLDLLDYIGTDKIMWSSDYPHNESTLGSTPESIRAVLDATSPDVARKILGGTAIELFDLA